MNNLIKYYYNINIYEDDIILKNNDYYFNDGQHEYLFYSFNDNKLIKVENYPYYQIITNCNGEVISEYNNKKYMLFLLEKDYGDSISVSDILRNRDYKINNIDEIMGWETLWSNKIDYYEQQIHEYGYKNQNIVNSFSYFLGMTENAIAYVNNAKKEYNNQYYDISICRKKIIFPCSKLDYYLLPNYIFDFNVRDYAEYIKMLFFNDNIEDYFDEIKLIISRINDNEINLSLFYARLLYPSYYFIEYDKVINNNESDHKIIEYIKKSEEYIVFLNEIFQYLCKIKPINKIDWIN